jgi:hypothetical protein
MFFSLSSVLSAEEVVNFRGDLDFLKKIFKLELNFKERSQLKTNLNLQSNKFYLTAKIEHLKFNGHDFSTELIVQGKIINHNNSKFLRCHLESKYALLDYKPFKDISSEFIINMDSLIISMLKWGDTNIIGDVALKAPYELNLYIEIKNTDINILAAIIGLIHKDFTISGSVSGFLRLKGPISRLEVSGQLRANRGHIADLLYDEILVKVDGVYPIIYLFDSEILEQDGVIYTFEGRVNLAEINNLYSGEHSFTFSPLTSEDKFNWHRWTIRRDKTRGNLEFEKRLRSGRPDRLHSNGDENIDLLGIEQTLKF